MINWQDSRDFFFQHFGTEPEVCCCAPGRANLIGEHIDYAGGQVLPLTIFRGISVAVRGTRSGPLRMVSAQYPQDGISTIEPGESADGQAGYVLELARIAGLTSAEIAICSDLPIGHGLSSSAALGIAVQAALLALKPDAVLPSARAVCRAAQRAEHLALGTSCGLMDQYACMFGSADNALLIDTWQQSHEYYSLHGTAGGSLLLLDSGQPRELNASLYNRRHAEMSAALAAAGRRFGNFENFRELSAATLLEFAGTLPNPTDRRLRHLVTEQQRVHDYCAALLAADTVAGGRLLDQSHASLRDHCEVSTPEIDKLVELVRATEGCLGARLMGGGFGGSVLAMLSTAPDAAALSMLLKEYSTSTGLTGNWFRIRPGAGAWISSGPDNARNVAEWLT